MMVRVRLFASLREIVGRGELELELREGSTPDDAWRELSGSRPGLAGKRASLSAAINRRYASFDDHLAEGDELVFIPPVSGG